MQDVIRPQFFGRPKNPQEHSSSPSSGRSAPRRLLSKLRRKQTSVPQPPVKRKPYVPVYAASSHFSTTRQISCAQRAAAARQARHEQTVEFSGPGQVSVDWAQEMRAQGAERGEITVTFPQD